MSTLAVNGQRAYLGYVILLSRVQATDQIYDLAIAIGCRIMRALCGSGWNPDEVLLARKPPLDPAPYQRFFRAPLRFDAQQSALVFPARWLDHPVATADPLLHRHLTQYAEGRHSNRQAHHIDEVRRLLRSSLADQKVDVRLIAKRLGMHARTLNRRLREEGTTFRQELNDVRYDAARQLLADTTMPLARIAAAIGYADTSAFFHAFKRWSGVSPTQWRRGQGRRV